MQDFCTSSACRHAALSEYFGQAYTPAPETPAPGCGGCDVCLGEMEEASEPKVLAQKIVSCVARLALTTNAGGFTTELGAKGLADILRGKASPAMRERGHDRLSTFGLLADLRLEEITGYIGQLIDQRVLRRATGNYPTVGQGEHARAVLRGELVPRLLRPKRSASAAPRTRDDAGFDDPPCRGAVRGSPRRPPKPGPGAGRPRLCHLRRQDPA